MQHYYHQHAPFKQDESGRFVVLRNLRFGCRGPAGKEYVVLDKTAQRKPAQFDNLTLVKCYIANHTLGVECAPWFGIAARDGHVRDFKIKLINRPEWKEITG